MPGLRPPADLPNLVTAVVLMVPAGAFKPSASAMALSKLSQHFRGRGHPYGIQEALSTLRPSCAPFSLTTPPWTQDALRVGGYPFPDRDFTLQELPSLLGAITLRLSRCQKRERSVSFWQSAGRRG